MSFVEQVSVKVNFLGYLLTAGAVLDTKDHGMRF